FGLRREAIDGRDDWRVLDLAHEQHLRASIGWHGLEVLARHVDANAGAGEGEEGLEDPRLGVVGKRIYLRQEASRRHRGMVERWERVLAPAEEPVRVAGPFDVELVGVPERQLDP